MSTTLFDWSACVAAFNDGDADKLANWRGYHKSTVNLLHRQKLIGKYDGNYAFPVHDERGNIIGVHHRCDDGSWRYSPGAKTSPLIIGDPQTATTAHLFESQWDALAVFDAFGGSLGDDDVTIITRGASNGQLAARFIRDEIDVILWKQNDEAADRWAAKIAETTKAAVIVALTPEPHKDPNEWLKAGALRLDFSTAREKAKPYRPEDAPQSESAYDLVNAEVEMPPEIIHGILHQGSKGALGGMSKGGKSYSFIDLALSVSNGLPWWGFETTRTGVYYVNLEIGRPFFRKRLIHVAEALGIQEMPRNLHISNKRGQIASLEKDGPRIIREAKRIGGIGLIILDPIYKLMAGHDENSAGDIGTLCNGIDKLATETGAAVVYAAHFSKGNQAAKESIDRISGSGVMARDPDAIITATAHEEECAYTVEGVLRNHPKFDPFVIRWSHPLMVRDGALDPTKLKKPKNGREEKFTVAMLTDEMGHKEWATAPLQRHMAEETGIGRSTFFTLLKKAEKQGVINQSTTDRKWNVVQ